jgi:O-antigen/teichoic acid export membrane protein
LAGGFLVFISLALLNTEAVRGLRLIRVFALMQLFPQGFTLFFLVFLGFLWGSMDIPVYATLGGFATTGLTGWLIMESAFRKRRQPADVIHPMSARKILTISFPMLMTTTMSIVSSETGVIMLGMFRSEAEVGYYAIAVKLSTLTSFVLNAVNSMAGPKFSELFHCNKMEELFHVAKKSSKLIFWTTVPILLGFILWGKTILGNFFGHEFAVVYPALVILSLGQFVNSVSGATGLFMNMTGNQNIFRNIMLVAALVNIAMNLLLTPQYGASGAAAAAMLSLAVWNLATLVYMKMKFGMTTGYFPVQVRP